MEDIFNSIDTNKDGKFSREEWNAIDTNKDDKITQQEWKRYTFKSSPEKNQHGSILNGLIIMVMVIWIERNFLTIIKDNHNKAKITFPEIVYKKG